MHKPSLRQRQHASVRIAKSLVRFMHYSAQPIAQAAHRQKQQAFAYCLIPCLLSQFLRTIVRMLSNQTRAKNPTAISHARLFGEACYARERIKAKPQFRYIACLVVTPDGARGIFGFAATNCRGVVTDSEQLIIAGRALPHAPKDCKNAKRVLFKSARQKPY